MKLANNLDANGNQIKNAAFETLATDATVGNFAGRLIYNSATAQIKWYNGTAFVAPLISIGQTTTGSISLTTSAAGAVTINIADAVSGTSGLLSSTNLLLLTGATNANTARAIVKRDVNGDFSVNNITIGKASPTADSDVATKKYVDDIAAGTSWKDAAHLGTSGSVNLTTGGIGASVTGVDQGSHSIIAGDRILVKNQTLGQENGIYVAAAGAWTRALDADTTGEILGMAVLVQEGGLAGTQWVLTTDGPITVGTTPLVFAQFGAGATTYTAGAGIVFNTNTIAVKPDITGTASITADPTNGLSVATTYAGGANIVTVGTIATGVWNATAISALKGGTGASLTPTIGGLLLGSSATAYSNLAIGTNGQTLVSNGTTAAWGAVSLATGNGVTGTLPVGNGGTGAIALTGILFGNGTAAVTALTTATDGHVLRRSAGTIGFGTIDLPNAVSGQLPIANGGTNATSASMARVNLGVPAVFTTTVPANGTITHNLGTRAVKVEVYETASPWGTVYTDVTRTDINTVQLGFSGTITSGFYTVVITAAGV